MKHKVAEQSHKKLKSYHRPIKHSQDATGKKTPLTDNMHPKQSIGAMDEETPNDTATEPQEECGTMCNED